MVDAAMKARQVTSTGKTLQDQLLERKGNRLIQEETDSQWLDGSKAFPAVSSVLPLSRLYQGQCLPKPSPQADVRFFIDDANFVGEHITAAFSFLRGKPVICFILGLDLSLYTAPTMSLIRKLQPVTQVVETPSPPSPIQCCIVL